MAAVPGRARRGFTLLEILLATGVMGAVLVAVAGAVEVGARRVMQARRSAELARLADTKLAEVHLVDDLGDVESSGRFDESPGHHWRVAIEDAPLRVAEIELGADLRKVLVTVESADGKDRIEFSLRRPAVRTRP